MSNITGGLESQNSSHERRFKLQVVLTSIAHLFRHAISATLALLFYRTPSVVPNPRQVLVAPVIKPVESRGHFNMPQHLIKQSGKTHNFHANSHQRKELDQCVSYNIVQL